MLYIKIGHYYGGKLILSKEIPKSIHSKKKIKIQCDNCKKKYESRYDYCVKNFEKYKINQCAKCSKQKAGDARKGKKRSKKSVEKALETRKKINAKKHPKFTLNCKFCNKQFTVPYKHRDRLYCSRSCQSKSIKRTDIRKTSTCIMCEKEFKHYGERILCGRKCNAKYLSLTRVGENNPAHKDKEKRKCLTCKEIFEHTSSGMHAGQKRVFCSLSCAHKIDLKGNSISGYSQPYPFGWNQKLKFS